jgi:hypothetical protein
MYVACVHHAGFIIISACMRLLADKGYCVERLLRRFKDQVTTQPYVHGYWARPKGVKKQSLLSD